MQFDLHDDSIREVSTDLSQLASKKYVHGQKASAAFVEVWNILFTLAFWLSNNMMSQDLTDNYLVTSH